MRSLLSIFCVLVAVSFASPQTLDAKGGKGGGGRGRSGFGGHRVDGAGHVSGNPKRSKNHLSHGHDGKHQPAERTKWNDSQTAKGQQFNSENGKDLNRKGRKSQLARTETGSNHESDLFDNGGGEPDAQPLNKKQKQLLIEQRNRDKRLAQAQHLREIAERNGNANLAANADRMEAFAHDHYARRVAHLEKFGVTDPLLDPDGDLLDPLTPDGDSLLPDGDPLLPEDQPLGDTVLGNFVESLLPFLP